MVRYRAQLPDDGVGAFEARIILGEVGQTLFGNATVPAETVRRLCRTVLALHTDVDAARDEASDLRAIVRRHAPADDGWLKRRLAAIPDEDIDLSDIPEASEEWFRQAKVR